jgi:adenosylcobinamide-phosphate synthase
LFEHIFQHSIFQQAITILPEFSVVLTLLIALWLDKKLGEAKRFHYLVYFGCLANKLETTFNPLAKASLSEKPTLECVVSKKSELKTKLRGTLAWSLLVLPLPILYFFFIENMPWYGRILTDAFVLYLAIGQSSLHQHAMQIYQPLQSGDLASARHFTGYIVSRETTTLTEQEISRATVESVLENGHDSVIASLINFAIGGAPLVILHRFANTLDAMWGYKSPRFVNFGYASARLDDLLGFISGKCCMLLYAVQALKQGNFFQAILNAYQQGSQYKSHNGGWVMAAGATVMQRKLGGSAQYHGKVIHSEILGVGKDVSINDIPKSLALVSRASLLLVALVFTIQLVSWL